MTSGKLDLLAVLEMHDHHNPRSKVHYAAHLMPEARCINYVRFPNPWGNRYLQPIRGMNLALRALLGHNFFVEGMLTELLSLSRATADTIIHFFNGDQSLPIVTRWHRRVVANFHSAPHYLEQRWRYRRWLQHLSHAVIVSETQRSFFAENGVTSDRISVIPLGIDFAYFRDLAHACIRREPSGVVVCGGWQRDFDFICRVLEKIGDEVQFSLVLSPDALKPRERAALGRLVRDHPFVTLLTGLPEPDYVGLIASASCVFTPFKMATANTALLEAAAIGTPIVANDLPAVREYWGGNGCLYFATGDLDCCCDILRSLVRQKLDSGPVVEAARVRVQELDWSKIVPKYYDIYRKLAA